MDAPEEAAAELVPPTAGRRRNMQANRRRSTGPERALRSLLHAAGYRYRVDMRISTEGGSARPDVVFTKRKVAVFVDGCFWHSYPIHGRPPTTNTTYWSPKLERNRQRDISNTALLEQEGWLVMRVWEHEAPADALSRVATALRKRGYRSRCASDVVAPGEATV